MRWRCASLGPQVAPTSRAGRANKPSRARERWALMAGDYLSRRAIRRNSSPTDCTEAARAAWIERRRSDRDVRRLRRLEAAHATEHGGLVDGAPAVVVHRLELLQRAVDRPAEVIEVVAAPGTTEDV